MAVWSAGEKITAVKNIFESSLINLTDFTSTAAATEQWGTEKITFPNPGGPVVVYACLTGRFLGISGSTGVGGHQVGVWCEISLDGGSTWDTGDQSKNYDTCIVSGTTIRIPVSVQWRTQGTPTGSIQVRVRVQSDIAGERYNTGRLYAQVTGL